MARQRERVPPGQARLEFKVYAPLNFGETVRLCGSTLVLGLMQHEQGIDLVTSSSTYPVWSTKELVAVFTMERIEYRYAVYRAGEFHRWENLERLDENRYITVRPELLPPLADGTPGTMLTILDRLATPELLRWGDEEIATLNATDTSVRAIADESAEYAALREADSSYVPEKPRMSEAMPNASLTFAEECFLSVEDRRSDSAIQDEVATRAQAARQQQEQQATPLVSQKVDKPAALRLGGLASKQEGAVLTPATHSPSSAAHQTAAGAALRAFLEEETLPCDGIEVSAPLTSSDGVVVVSLFLPVLIRRKRIDGQDCEWNIEWDLENLLSLQAPLRVTRVGLARVPDDTTPSERQRLAATLRRPPWYCISIFLDRETYVRPCIAPRPVVDATVQDLYYHVFCKGVLWPVFHNSLEVYGEKAAPTLEFDDTPFSTHDGGFANQTDSDENEHLHEMYGSFQEKASERDATLPETLLAVVASAERLDAAVKRDQSAANFSELDESDMPGKAAPPAAASGSPNDIALTTSIFSQENNEIPTPASDQALSPELGPQAPTALPHKRLTRTERAWRAYKKVRAPHPRRKSQLRNVCTVEAIVRQSPYWIYQVNQIFREHVVEAYNEGDLVWIHGFQLALLPAFVSRRLTVAKLGLFLHTPFPSSEIFRTLSMRSELLRGILSADQVGFHLYEYARHFLTTCRRLLGVRYDFDPRGPVITIDGRDVVIACIHAGVEPADLADVASTPAGIRAVKDLRRELQLNDDDEDPPTNSPETISVTQRTRVIAGIDKLELLRGLPLKLLAYERFLDARKQARDEVVASDGGQCSVNNNDRDNLGPHTDGEGDDGDSNNLGTPETKADGSTGDDIDFRQTRGHKQKDDVRVVLVQYAISSVERNADCERTRRDSTILVDRIRAKHGDDCIVWREMSQLKIVDRLALLKVADIFWVSSVRDGLNRWPLEYVAMQSDVLLGGERHAAALARTPTNDSSIRSDDKETMVPYFDDIIERMINAADGPGFPSEDPCTYFAPKRKFRRRKKIADNQDGTHKVEDTIVEKIDDGVDDCDDLADDIFPSLDMIADDERDDTVNLEWARAETGKQLMQPPLEEFDDDYFRDESGKKYYVFDLSKRNLSRTSRRRLRAYLNSSDKAKREHAARHARCRSRRLGGLLLSENASAARVLLGAVSVNPWRIDDSTAAISALLDMTARERMARHARDSEFLARSTTAKWAYRVLHDLKSMRKDDNRMNATHAGLGLNFRVLGMRSGFDALQVDRVARAFRLSARPVGKAVARSIAPTAAPENEPDQFLSARQTPTNAGNVANKTPARIIVLDYGGTLVPDAAAASLDSVAAYAIARGERHSPKPSAEVKRILVTLANDPRNIVFVVSGRERADLLDSLGDVLNAAPDLGLCAEHGFFVRWPQTLRAVFATESRNFRVRSSTSKSHDDIDREEQPQSVRPKVRSYSSDAVLGTGAEATSSIGDAAASPFPAPSGVPDDEHNWERFSSLDETASKLAAWRAVVLTTMDMFTQRTQGTYIEKHESSLVWQYRDADPDYGEMQAKELEHQLADVLLQFSSVAQILRGENPSRGGYVEVRPAGVDKGAFLTRLLVSLAASGRPVDFALVVGDDESDEPMFRALSSWKKQAQGDASPRATVGSDSFFSVCIELLQALARVSNRLALHYSAIDLLVNERDSSIVPLGRNDDTTIAVIGDQAASKTEDADAGESKRMGAQGGHSVVRSISMPLIAHSPQRRATATEKVPSWITFEEATSGDDIIAEEQEGDDAAMFF